MTAAAVDTKRKFEDLAWRFLESEFTGMDYADWPIDRRLDAYLMRQDMTDLRNDGAAYAALLDCVMASVGRALRMGIVTRAPHQRRPRLPG